MTTWMMLGLIAVFALLFTYGPDADED